MKLILLLLSVLSAYSVVVAQTRTALVMGVGDYGGAKYKGNAIQNLPGITTADLPNMAAKLESLGFTVTVVPNPTLSQAKTAVDTFSAKIKAAPGVSLFYFSGHGGEYEGKNYLIPRGASIGSKADLSDEALSAQRVLNGMEESGAQVNLVFLDCCREDLGKSVGGAEMAPLKARGSFIGFATRSGDFADPDEQGSPYTRFLLKHLDKPGVSVSDMYGFVARDVGEYSKTVLGEERRPGFYSELAGEPFYFVPASFTRTDPAMAEAEIERRARELAARMVPQTPGTPDTLKREQRTGSSVLDSGAVGKSIQVKLPGEVLMKFSYCPAGSFMMGSPASEKDRTEDEAQVQVRISQGYWMGQTEVTQGQWKALMGSNPSRFKGDDLPVETVSWEEAQAFIEKLNQSVPLTSGWKYALPTEAQWEYACRAGTESVFSFGDVLNGKQANCDGNYPYGTSTKGPNLEKTCDVASYQPNAWGLYDMHGNVWEWCRDAWDGRSKLAGGTDPMGDVGSLRVRRGGSWRNYANDCRAANRSGITPGYADDDVGFRLAAVPEGGR